MENVRGYYPDHAARCLRLQRRLMRSALPGLRARFESATVDGILLASKREFERMLPSLPSIGGRRNNFTDTLIRAAGMIALYRALAPGVADEQFGDLVDEIAIALIGGTPQWLLRLTGRVYMSSWFRRRTEKLAGVSARDPCRCSFVYRVIPGNGTGFDWGIDYLRCGVVEFFRAEGVESLSKFMCRMDDRVYPAIGVELTRSGTIADGADRCDFRFARAGRSSRGRP